MPDLKEEFGLTSTPRRGGAHWSRKSSESSRDEDIKNEFPTIDCKLWVGHRYLPLRLALETFSSKTWNAEELIMDRYGLRVRVGIMWYIWDNVWLREQRNAGNYGGKMLKLILEMDGGFRSEQISPKP